MPNYFIEITDTFGGEPNYSWVTRHKVRASSPRGAMVRIGRAAGMAWHIVGDYGDMVRYDSKSGATCAFVQGWDNDTHGVIGRVETNLEV